ncbi:MAG: hypothetical protein OHK0046_00780 [Anaerolineae bacterium]
MIIVFFILLAFLSLPGALPLPGALSGVASAQEPEACTPASGEPLRIGAILPQQALLSLSLMEPYESALAMADAFNACGGVNGRPVEWLFVSAVDRRDAQEALTELRDQGITLIVGSGTAAVREVLETASADGSFVLWEISETLEGISDWAFTTRPTHRQLGEVAAQFVQTDLQQMLGLRTLQTAFIYEERPRGEDIARGVRASLPLNYELGYGNSLNDTRSIARRIRQEQLNVVLVSTFDSDADGLWYALREADANIAAWVHIGGPGYRSGLCRRYGNNDALISVTTLGEVSMDYQEALDGDRVRLFREHYVRANSSLPSQSASSAAAGVYMLLRYVLPELNGDLTPENIRETIMSVDVPPLSGLMGEGLAIDPETNVNRYPGVLIQQRQNGQFCTLWPEGVATCSASIEPFPTWRERALRTSGAVCQDPV